MNFIVYQERLNYLLNLVEKGSVHSPKQITTIFFCSDKTARNMINTLRQQGHVIVYCRKEKKYLLKK